MTIGRKALWSVSGVVAAPAEAVWTALLKVSPELKGQDVARFAASQEPQRFTVPLTLPLEGSMQVEVDARSRRLATQGAWWYRGVIAVTPHAGGSQITRQIFNVAPLASRWLVRFVHHHDPVAFRNEHKRLLEGLGGTLGCKASLLPG